MSRSAADPTTSLPVAKIGEFRTVLGSHLTQGPLKSLSYPAAFQADDEGLIPFARSNLFNDLSGARGAHCIKPEYRIVSWRSDLGSKPMMPNTHRRSLLYPR
jgi:hypothetical protein